jgi:hypothetical protein
LLCRAAAGVQAPQINGQTAGYGYGGLLAHGAFFIGKTFRKASIRRSDSLTRLNVLRIDLRRLFANFCRIDDEFERIGVLALFHQLQINEPLGAFE